MKALYKYIIGKFILILIFSPVIAYGDGESDFHFSDSFGAGAEVGGLPRDEYSSMLKETGANSVVKVQGAEAEVTGITNLYNLMWDYHGNGNLEFMSSSQGQTGVLHVNAGAGIGGALFSEDGHLLGLLGEVNLDGNLSNLAYGRFSIGPRAEYAHGALVATADLGFYASGGAPIFSGTGGAEAGLHVGGNVKYDLPQKNVLQQGVDLIAGFNAYLATNGDLSGDVTGGVKVPVGILASIDAKGKLACSGGACRPALELSYHYGIDNLHLPAAN